MLATSSADEITARSFLVGVPGYRATNEVPAGRVLIILEDDVYDTRADVPARVTHRLSATFGDLAAGEPGSAGPYPKQVTQLEPVQPEVGRPYYRAVSSFDALAILEESREYAPPSPGRHPV